MVYVPDFSGRAFVFLSKFLDIIKCRVEQRYMDTLSSFRPSSIQN